MKKIATVALLAAALASPSAFAKSLNLGVGAAVVTSGLLTSTVVANTAVTATVPGNGAVLGKNGLIGSLLTKGLTVGVGASAAACGC